MKETVNRGLFFYEQATGNNSIGYQEQWEYTSPNPNDPYHITIFGHTRFEEGHVRIDLPDGSRFVQFLRMKNLEAPLKDMKSLLLGKGKVYQTLWPGGFTLPPEKRNNF